MKLLALVAAALLPSAVLAECTARDVMIGYLRDRGLTLHSWGLNSAGEMDELFLSPDGNFVVLRTTPTGDNCVSVVSALDREGGRLWQPPRQNRSLRPNGLNDGTPG